MDPMKVVEDSGSTVYVFLVCIVAAVGGLSFGFDTAVIAGTIPFLTKHFALSENVDRYGLSVDSVLFSVADVSGYAGKTRWCCYLWNICNDVCGCFCVCSALPAGNQGQDAGRDRKTLDGFPFCGFLQIGPRAIGEDDE